MKHSCGTFAAAAILIALICSPSVPIASAQLSTKAYALPGAVTDATSIVSNLPNFMVSMDEGGTVLNEPKATCDNRADPNGKAGLHLEHYFADAKVVFEQKAGVLRQFPIKQDLQNEAGSAAVVSEILDGAEAANPNTTRVKYHARLFRDTTYAEISIDMSAVGPDTPRKYAREMMQKIGALNYSSVK